MTTTWDFGEACPTVQNQLVLDTAADLREFNPGSGGCDPVGAYTAFTLGAVSRSDGGGGHWYWDASSDADDNLGTILCPTGRTEPGRWLRVFSGAVNVRWWGVTGDGVTDVSTTLQSILDDFLHIYFPQGTYVCKELDIDDRSGMTIEGAGGAYSYATQLYCTDLTADYVLKRMGVSPNLVIRNLMIRGPSEGDEFGEDTDCIGLMYYGWTNSNLDSTLVNCQFNSLNAGVTMDVGRNIKMVNCGFGNSKRGFWANPAGASYIVGMDNRDVEFVGCRFHTLGKYDSVGMTRTGGIVIDPEMGIKNVIAEGCLWDFCYSAFDGFASGSRISGVAHRMHGPVVNLTGTGYNDTGTPRWFTVNMDITGADPVGAHYDENSGITTDEFNILLRVFDTHISNVGTYGMQIRNSLAWIDNCTVLDCSQDNAGVWSAFDVDPYASPSRITNCTVYQTTGSAKYGFEFGANSKNITMKHFGLRAAGTFASGRQNLSPVDPYEHLCANTLFYPDHNGIAPVKIVQAPGMVADLFEIENSAGSQLFRFDKDGNAELLKISNQITGKTGQASVIRFGTTAYPVDLLLSGGMFGPYANNTYTCGLTGYRWSKMWSVDLTTTNAPVVDSDEKVKKDLKDSTLGLQFIQRLKPKEFKHRDDEEGKTRLGLVAQELKDVLPAEIDGLVREPFVDLEGGEAPWGIAYTELIMPLIKAVQELSEEVAALKKDKSDA